jgi:hypothetical protein
MFSAGREIAADQAEDLGPFERPKAARDFLLDLGHADVVFALIVGEWHERVGQESQSLDFELAETLKEIAGFGFGNASTSSGVIFRIRWWAFTVASGQNISITAAQSVSGFFAQAPHLP